MASASPLFEQAIGLHRKGALAEAGRLYLQILADNPGDGRARQMLAALRVGEGRFAEALDECERVLAAEPGAIEALMQKGFALEGLGRNRDALAHYDHILRLGPDFPPALYFRGRLLIVEGRCEEALQSLDRVLARDAGLVDAWVCRGSALQQLNRHEESVVAFDRALALKSDYPKTWFNRGRALAGLGRNEDALASYGRAVALDPAYGKAHNNRAGVLMALRRFREAARAYEAALAADPAQHYAFGGLAAAALYACDWQTSAKLGPQVERHIAQSLSVISPAACLGLSDDPALLQRAARAFTHSLIPSPPTPLWRGEKFRNDKIRIAYCSSDFHEHATGHLIAELFERHDRDRFEIWGIGFDANDRSALRRRMVKAFDRFVDTRNRSDRDTAAFLHAEHVDIAVDLKGHTAGGRQAVFAHRPCPIQVNYLGFPGTLGGPYWDYIIGDPIVTPLQSQAFYDEKIVQLQGCYQPNDATRIVAPAPTRTQAGLPEHGFVFCCFNNSWKITPDIFDVWMRLLQAVPQSVLWLIDDNDDARISLTREAVARGIAPDRLVFAPRLDVELHLARHRLADLFLDTVPYNAHTTASDCLRAGVPLVTMTGYSFQGRVASSLLQAVGLGELAAQSLQDYERIALGLAQGGAEAARQKLQSVDRTPLFDSDRFRRNIEAAYGEMWRLWQAGEPPRAFAAPG